MKPIGIAIDGPSGAGKSTIAKIISKEIGFIYIDTGAMYRAVGLKTIQAKIESLDAIAVGALLQNISIDIVQLDDVQKIFLDGKDVSEEIRTPEVSIAASNVATIPAVRIRLVDLQRKLAEKQNVIMDGRDIATYVLPNADLKIFLTATVEDRARRRYEELLEKKIDCTFEEVKKDMEYRDKNDSSRDFAPLKIDSGAIVVDTTGFSLKQSIETIKKLIYEKLELV